MSTPDVSKDFNETHMGRFDQILVVDGSAYLKATYDNAKHIITNPGPVHSVVILNAFENLHYKYTCESIRSPTSAYTKTLNREMEKHKLDSIKTNYTQLQAQSLEDRLHIDNDSEMRNPITISINIMGQGTGIDTRSTTYILHFNGYNDLSKWSINDNIDTTNTSHCLYAPPNSISFIREEGIGFGKKSPPSLHVSGKGDRLVGLHFN